MNANSWVEITTVVTGFFATMTAAIGLVVALRSDRRSREALKVQTYLQLRAVFLDIFRELGRLEDAGDEGLAIKLARQAYWHHTWDEWYVAKRLAPHEFASLWDDFFAEAVRSGIEHDALWATLEDLARDRKAGFGAYAQELINVVRAMKDAPRDRGRDVG